MLFTLFAVVAADGKAASCFSASPGPLNIATPITPENNALLLQYSAGSTSWLVQQSTDRLALVADGIVGGAKYQNSEYLAQYGEIHMPAEHTLGAKRQVYPAELQLYHASAQGKVMALSLLFKKGAPSAFLETVLGSLNKGPGQKIDIPMSALLQGDDGYFAYATPRCPTAQRQLGQADQWVLLSKMATASDDQLARLAKAMPTLSSSSRQSVDAKEVPIFSSLHSPAPAAPQAPVPGPMLPPPPAALVQGGAAAQSQGGLNAVLSAYQPEQRQQLLDQYTSWYNSYEKYLGQVQGNTAYTNQELAYEQYQNQQKRAEEHAANANVLSGGFPMSLLETSTAANARSVTALQMEEEDVARREVAVAQREQAVATREQQVASLAQSLASMEAPRRLRGEAAPAPPAKVAHAKAAQGESFAQLGAKTKVRAKESSGTGTGTGSAVGIGDLHIVEAADLPADSGDHEDAATVASATGDDDGEDGEKTGKVEDAPSTTAEDAAGENADNDDLESILLQKKTRTKRLKGGGK